MTIHKTGRTATPSEKDRATATRNMHKNVKFGHVVFKLLNQTDTETVRQTHRHTYCNTSQPYRGKVTTVRGLSIQCIPHTHIHAL